MQLTAEAIEIVTLLWLLVLATLLGLIDVAQYRYEDKGSRLLGLLIAVPTVAAIFALALFVTMKVTNLSYENPNVIYGLPRFARKIVFGLRI